MRPGTTGSRDSSMGKSRPPSYPEEISSETSSRLGGKKTFLTSRSCALPAKVVPIKSQYVHPFVRHPAMASGGALSNPRVHQFIATRFFGGASQQIAFVRT